MHQDAFQGKQWFMSLGHVRRVACCFSIAQILRICRGSSQTFKPVRMLGHVKGTPHMKRGGIMTLNVQVVVDVESS